MKRGVKTGISKKIEDRDAPNIPEKPHDMPLLLDTKSAAKLLGVSGSYLIKGRLEGVLKGRTAAPPCVYVSGRVFYRYADLIAWTESLTSKRAV